MARKVKPEIVKVSAEAQLFHSQFQGVAQQALAAVQNALAVSQNMIAQHMAKMDGLNVQEGWKINLDKMHWVKVIPPPEQ